MAIQTEGVDLRFAQVSALSYKIGWLVVGRLLKDNLVVDYFGQKDYFGQEECTRSLVYYFATLK
jgi:hypothetical protein